LRTAFNAFGSAYKKEYNGMKSFTTRIARLRLGNATALTPIPARRLDIILQWQLAVGLMELKLSPAFQSKNTGS